MILDRLCDIREDNNLTQSEVAKILKISQSQYSLYETGERSIPIEKLIILADFFEVSIDYLVGRTDSPIIITKHQNEISEPFNTSKPMVFFNRLNLDNQYIILGKMAELYKEQQQQHEAKKDIG